MKKPSVYPKPGDRCGFVCGPCESPRGRSGIVMTISSDSFYSHIAHVLLDDGTTESMIGAYTTVGIGCYLIEPAEVAA